MSKMETKWEPPRGIRLLHIAECINRPHAVQWRSEGRRKTKGFPTRTAAVAFAKSLASEIRAHGPAALRLDEDAIREWRAFRDVVGHDVPLSEVAECWRQHGRRARITIGQAIERLTAAKRAEGMAANTLRHYKAIHDRMRAAWGDRPAADITREEVAAWLGQLGMAPVSVATHFVRVRALFTWLRVNRHITFSPCDGMRPPRVVPDEVKILTVEQGRRLFGPENCAASRELMGRLALEAFAGVRFSSAAAMSEAEIRFGERGLVLAAAKIKTRRRQFIDGLPDNLWRWLEWSRPSDWKMASLHEYMHAKSGAQLRAGFDGTTWPRNGLRHSFCTYHIAAHKDASRTSVILCHASPRMLYQHYRGCATEEAGKAWFEIMPPAS